MGVKNLAAIAEQIYFDYPRLNSKAALRDICDMNTMGQLDCTQLDLLMDMVIKRVNNPRVGEFLQIEHSRKGKFIIQVKKVDEEWITGVIVDGVASAIMNYNVKYEGEEIQCRRSLCCFYPIKPVQIKQEA